MRSRRRVSAATGAAPSPSSTATPPASAPARPTRPAPAPARTVPRPPPRRRRPRASRRATPPRTRRTAWERPDRVAQPAQPPRQLTALPLAAAASSRGSSVRARSPRAGSLVANPARPAPRPSGPARAGSGPARRSPGRRRERLGWRNPADPPARPTWEGPVGRASRACRRVCDHPPQPVLRSGPLPLHGLEPIVPTHRARTTAAAGIERTDSITLDPHNGFFLAFGTGCLLVRHTATLPGALRS